MRLLKTTLQNSTISRPWISSNQIQGFSQLPRTHTNPDLFAAGHTNQKMHGYVTSIYACRQVYFRVLACLSKACCGDANPNPETLTSQPSFSLLPKGGPLSEQSCAHCRLVVVPTIKSVKSSPSLFTSCGGGGFVAARLAATSCGVRRCREPSLLWLPCRQATVSF